MAGGRPLQAIAGTKSARERERRRWDRVVAIVIAALRNDADLTQEELAAHLGWTRDAVANIERGRRVVRVSDLILIARVLRMKPEELTRKIVSWQQA